MKRKLAITMGDAAGIGPEITVKALAVPTIYDTAIPVVYGDYAPLADAIRFLGSPLRLHRIASSEEARGQFGEIDLIDLGMLEDGGWEYQKNQANVGEASFQYVVRAIRDAMDKRVDAVVTGPISKEAIHMAGHRYSGHTEIFAEYTGTKDFTMLLSGHGLNVVHVTTHVSMRQACDLITQERVMRTIRLARRGMRLLGCDNPRIGVAGFNPHASENGLFGDQEARAIIPAVAQAQAEGMDVTGPVPADTAFCKMAAGVFDVVVAMYHDQGHIPVKLLGFRMDARTNRYTSVSGINCTIGLPIIRTSVDHGTAYDRAGEGQANEESMNEAMRAAITMSEKLQTLG